VKVGVKVTKPEAVGPSAEEATGSSALASALPVDTEVEGVPPGAAHPQGDLVSESTSQLGGKSGRKRARRRPLKDDYKVGYCKPPQATRFVKGKSGNPMGRPPSYLRKGPRAVFMDILMNELDSPITVMEGNRRKRISKQRAVIKNLVKCAIDGSTDAIAGLFKLVRQHRVNLNDIDSITASVARFEYFYSRSVDIGRMTESEMKEKDMTYLAYLINPISYMTGQLRLPPNHTLNRNAPRRMRPLTTIADDLRYELRETITITKKRRKFTILKLHALVKSLLHQAILGDKRALSLLIALYKEYDWHKEDRSFFQVSPETRLGRFIGLSP
jgi:hypothetical protein